MVSLLWQLNKYPLTRAHGSGAGETLEQGRRRQAQKVFVRGYDGGRRRRRCSKSGAKNWRIYQKLEPGNGANYDKENGDAQFNNGCS